MAAGNWPLHNLDTILETSATRSLRSPASAPRLRSSPQRSPYITRVQDLVDVRGASQAAQVSNCHSLSAPNLDLTEKLLSYHHSAGSSSSSQALKDISTNPAGPALPIAEPIQRRPTPEGLPSFGSKEAQELRLFPETAFMRRARAIAHWFRGDRETSDGALSERSPTITVAERLSSASLGSAHGLERSVPMDMLQRLLGAPRVVETSEQLDHPAPRVGLPRGVVVSDSPGVLATAPDGTFVRGKFGARMSAHGVGSRALDGHPLADERTEQKPVSHHARNDTGSILHGPASELTSPALEIHRVGHQNPAFPAPLPTLLIAPQSMELGDQPTPVPISIGFPSMQEPQLYTPSPHDRSADSSRHSQGASRRAAQDNWNTMRSEAERSRQQQLSEKSEGGRCHGCCKPLPPRQPNGRQHRQTRRSATNTGTSPSATGMMTGSLAAASAFAAFGVGLSEGR